MPNGKAFKQVGYSAFRLPIKRTKAKQRTTDY